MSVAHIHCVFGWDPNEDSPELLTAWDEYGVEQNPDGFEDDAKMCIAARDIPERYVRRARLVVDWGKVEELYADVEIDAGLEA